MKSFDIRADLPAATTVLEASAGTGKTFAIAALATRYVAEGHARLSDLMIVTFSRAATQELRERVRERLVSAERGLAELSRAPRQNDELLELLSSGPAKEVAHRRRRLTRALAEFDSATIATTHGFCQQMLAELGFAGDGESELTFAESIDDLVSEVVDDLYVRKFGAEQVPPAIDYRIARAVAREAMHDPQAALAPEQAPAGSAARQRYGLACAVRLEVERRKRARRILDYDDMLTRLRDVLVDPIRGEAARARIRERFKVVLVDEFQDTDPVQWEILSAGFHGSTTLVLVGDPKQAIYAFRGADLVTYLNAVGEAAAKQTLDRNWRTDHDLVIALQTVFGDTPMGHPEIVVHPVRPVHTARRLEGANGPLRLRVMTRASVSGPGNESSLPGVARLRRLVAADLAADVVALLSGPARLSIDRSRQVRPSDIAVLVRTNDQAALVRTALGESNVPAVVTGSTSVFRTAMARAWLLLLRAVEQPHRAGLVRSAALTPFIGWDATRLAEQGTGPDRLGAQLRVWRDVLTSRGVAAMLEVVSASTDLARRLLASPGGERDLTDLRHIGNALHAAAMRSQLGPTALAEWLQRHINESLEDPAEERSRRLDSDAEAVQVVTVHSSKGMEFPIVYLPFSWDRFVADNPDPLRYHSAAGIRTLDVGGSTGPAYLEARTRHREEESGEDLRLLYVAMTRAKCQVTAWWAPSPKNTRASALHRLLFAVQDRAKQVRDRIEMPDDAKLRARLGALEKAAAGSITVEWVLAAEALRWDPHARREGELEVAMFDRALDENWRRTSYSSLTSAAHRQVPGVLSEPESARTEDEPAEPGALPEIPVVTDRGADIVSPMAAMPVGAAFGTLVHRVFEIADTANPDLSEELRLRTIEAAAQRPGGSLDPAALAAALLPSFRTPLGPLARGRRLCDFPAADRLSELEFELPLIGGDEPGPAHATVTAIADTIARHLDSTDPLAPYPAALKVPDLRSQTLRGYLTGSIDAVLRVPDDQGEASFLVVDYKTNWLGAFGSDPPVLSALDYRSDSMIEEMLRQHYPLQALLYSVALHRFLRWRLPKYDPGRHLGGVLYLFVRGMCGPETPEFNGVPCGVFSWLPPVGLVGDLSDLLDRGVART